MSSVYGEVYLHLIWATKGREPLIPVAIRPRIYNVVRKQCAALNVGVLAIGGVADHVHLLVCLPTTVTIAELARRAKGASSHFMSHIATDGGNFEWQKGYGVFTIHRVSIERVQRYIDLQEEHHSQNRLIHDLEIVSHDECALPQLEAVG